MVNYYNKLGQKAIDSIEAAGLQVIDSCEELHRDGTTEHYFWFFHPKTNELWETTDRHTVFYSVPSLDHIKKTKEIIDANAPGVKLWIEKEKQQKEEDQKIDIFLSACFGDSLPANKAKHTVLKYLHRDLLLDYANGKQGIDGLRAEGCFFKTKAWSTFYSFVKE
ncbi:MAG: hypothetical protein ACKO37_08050 [Vampirovibrionales bacterium]